MEEKCKSQELEKLEEFIRNETEDFQKALKNDVEASLLTYLKKNLDYLRDKRNELYNELKREKTYDTNKQRG